MIRLGRWPSRYATPARKRSTRLPLVSFRPLPPMPPQPSIGSRPGMYGTVARAPGAAVEEREELGPCEHLAVARVRGGRHLHAARGHGERSVVPHRIPDHFAFAVHCAIGRLARHFGAAVAVEVVRNELRVVGARTDVAAEH